MAKDLYCSNGHVTELTNGAEIYPHREDLKDLPFWICRECQEWVGCHIGTTNPKGRPANAVTRKLKIHAHAKFDPLWKTPGRMSRSQAYAWLAKQLDLPPEKCHMGWMTDEQLRKVVRVCGATRYLDKYRRSPGKPSIFSLPNSTKD